MSAGAGAGAGAGVGVTAAAKDAPAEEADDDVSRRHAVHKNSSAFAHLAKYVLECVCCTCCCCKAAHTNVLPEFADTT